MGQLLQYSLPIVDPPKLLSTSWMVNEFIEIIRGEFKEKGFSKVDNNEEFGGNFLVGVNGRLFHIFSDFQINEYVDGFTADGSGREYALAAMEALKTFISDPFERIIESIKIADKFCTSICLPIIVVGDDSFVVSDEISR